MSTKSILLLVLFGTVCTAVFVVLGVLVNPIFMIGLPVSGLPLGIAGGQATANYYDRRWRE